jgi:F0F1-type ATP synthase membrane subunit c/vacuolar-type H+-ATPase subunit K
MREMKAVISEMPKAAQTSAIATGPTDALIAPEEMYVANGAAVAAATCCQTAAARAKNTVNSGVASTAVQPRPVNFFPVFLGMGKEEWTRMEIKFIAMNRMLGEIDQSADSG